MYSYYSMQLMWILYQWQSNYLEKFAARSNFTMAEKVLNHH